MKGEWVEEKVSESIVKGQYFPDNSGMMKVGRDGDEKPVHGQFSTLQRPIADAVGIRIDSIALDAKIICWESFQTHSVIYV